MFFLLRTAFWLTIALALLPTGQTQQTAQAPKVDPVDALVAAGSAVSDMSGFCQRQAQACEVGSQTAAAIGQRAMAGGKMVYEFINEQVATGLEGGSTGSLPPPRPEPALATAKSIPVQGAPVQRAAIRTGAQSAAAQARLVPVVLPVPVPRPGRSTLTPADLEPAWQGPAPHRSAGPRRDSRRPA